MRANLQRQFQNPVRRRELPTPRLASAVIGATRAWQFSWSCIGSCDPVDWWFSRLAVVLIDPKHGVDYGPLGHLPHIQGGIMTKMEDALPALSLTSSSSWRYPMPKQAGVNHV